MVRVVDLSDDVAGGFASKLFALAGVDVVRPAAADPSPLGRYLHAHKQLVAAPGSDDDARALVAAADVVFTSFDRGRYDGAAARSALRPPPGACVEVTTSTFGTTGPYSYWRGGPLADWAAGGYLAITGWPDREPLIGPERLCGYVAGYTAAIAAEAALHERRRTGRGRHVDVSVMESMLNVHQSTFSRLAAGIVRVRTGRYTEVYPLVVRPCRTGYVSLGVVTDVEFDRLLIAIGRDDLVADERFRDPGARWEHRDALDAELEGFLGAHDADDVVHQLGACGVAVAKVAEVADLLANPQLAHREFWDHVDADGARAAPGNPVPAPFVHASAPGDPAPRPSSALRSSRRADLPLDGIVVVDFTAFWAGPSATRMLADLGARVIWVERPRSRREPDASADATEVVMHYFHHKMNRHKESVVLDLRTDAGCDLARRLAAESDVLVENFRPGVMHGFGLDAPALCAANPGLVYVSLSGFGSTGPWSDRRSYGPTIEAASSIEARTGYAGGEPLRLGHTLPDGVGGLVGALAALRGLRERAERGIGGWYDVSQLEAYAALSGEDLLLAADTGRGLERCGNRSRYGSVQGVFPGAGDDEWLALRLADESDVARAALVLGVPGLVAACAAVPRDDDAVDELVASITALHSAHALATELQAAGLEAFPVLTPPELVADAHLVARGFFVDVAVGGRTIRLPGSPLHDLADPRGAAPRFGEHTDAVIDRLSSAPDPPTR